MSPMPDGVLPSRLRRVMLFVPAISEKMIRKAAGLNVDCVIFDLEDSVAPADKLAARDQLARLLPELDFAGKECLLRINSPASSDLWRQDLDSLIDLVDGLVIPKVDEAAHLQMVYEALPAAKVVFAIIESAQALLKLDMILVAAPQLTGVMLGGEDMAVDMNMPSTADHYYLDFARFRLVMLARAFRLQAIDTVEADLTLSEPELESAAQHARRFGFDGKLAIHPETDRALAGGPVAHVRRGGLCAAPDGGLQPESGSLPV